LYAKQEEMTENYPEAEEATQDAYLALKDLSISNATLLSTETAESIDLSKCYIKALVDDDTYFT
jgi:hypothetical protein